MLLEYKNETLSLNEGDIVLVDPVETISMYPQGFGESDFSAPVA